MSGWPEQPVIYEVNTAVWLDSLSRKAGRPMTLADVPAEAWDAITPAGIDAVWLMGVWERSPAGLLLAKANPERQSSFRATLPDLCARDVIGSPYCIRRYVADPAFGGPDGLAVARAELAGRGVRLVLDYVPNHVAPDHPWVHSSPWLFVRGRGADLEADPGAWLAVGGYVLAYGRDPNFAPWPDVVQLDAFSPDLRAATVRTLGDIADQCDGIRCDMAMLMTNEVFGRTWGAHVGAAPAEEFWPMVIRSLRADHPDTLLVAEAYWDMEWTLQQQGFDFCYDKRLYDRTVVPDPPALRDHLRSDLGYQSRLLRFLENHDEPRLADRLSHGAQRAVAVAVATLPGATLWHEGQFEGRHVHASVFLNRRPDEPTDDALADWYHGLLTELADGRVRAGAWQLLEPVGWPDNQSCRSLVAWSWTSQDDTVADGRHLVVVNLSDHAAQARIRLPWPDLAGAWWRLVDVLDESVYKREGDELADLGLFVSLAPWQSHLFSVTKAC